MGLCSGYIFVSCCIFIFSKQQVEQSRLNVFSPSTNPSQPHIHNHVSYAIKNKDNLSQVMTSVKQHQ
jgi:uncharacterized lipoprotein YajG